MKLIPIDVRDIPNDQTGKKKDSLPMRIYEAALITFFNGAHAAVRVEEGRATKSALYHGFLGAIERLRYPCEVVMRDGNVYLIKQL